MAGSDGWIGEPQPTPWVYHGDVAKCVALFCALVFFRLVLAAVDTHATAPAPPSKKAAS
jgi:hypothetical protein